MKRQASVLALRFIDPNEYIAPLGVWVVKEATRAALQNKPIEFATKELMLHYAKLIGSRKFGCNVEKIIEESLLLKNMQNQSKLTQFF
jgi:hypothetical protein